MHVISSTSSTISVNQSALPVIEEKATDSMVTVTDSMVTITLVDY